MQNIEMGTGDCLLYTSLLLKSPIPREAPKSTSEERLSLIHISLHQRIAELQTQHDDALAVVKDLDARMVSLKELRGHLVVYRQYKPLAQKLQTVRNPAKFKEQHRAELAVYEAACAYFKANGLRTLPDLKKLDAEYQTLSSEKNGFYTRYKKAQIELRELRTPDDVAGRGQLGYGRAAEMAVRAQRHGDRRQDGHFEQEP